MSLTLIGIKEVQIIQWFVEPEARVEQFDKICEVQSDKAAVEVFLSSFLSNDESSSLGYRSHPDSMESLRSSIIRPMIWFK